MGYPLTLAVRYLGSRKRASISVGTAIAVLGVMLGVAALLTVMSVTGGFQAEFRDKVLGVNAHVLVLKHSTEFRNYRDVMEQVHDVPGVLNVAPFSINPMMLAHGEKTATGVLLKGVDPKTSLGVGLDPNVPPVLDLPRHVYKGLNGECAQPIQMSCGVGLLEGLRRDGATPPPRRGDLEPKPIREPEEEDAADAGVVADPDAGAPDWLRQEMKNREKAGGQGAPPPLPDDEEAPEDGAAPSDDPGEDAADAGTEATPDGGYKSVLPEDDELPDGVETDECEDPELVKKLPGIVIGKSLAETLKLQLGDCVTVTSPTIGFQFSGGEVKPAVAKNFRVMALFEAGFDQYDSKLVYTDLYEAQVFYDEGDTVTGVEMKIDDIEKSDEVVEAVQKVVPPSAYRTMDWKELNRGLFTALLIQKVMMSGVLALIILVAAFTVVATLIMVVLDKKREVSVLKAMGATDTAVLRIFLYQGLFIGGVGTALGLLVGFAVCKGLIVWAFPLDPKVYFIDHLPVLLRTDEFLITGAVAIVLCLLGTALPSLYAASLVPADGLRDIQGGSSGLEAGEALRSGWELLKKRALALLLVPAVGWALVLGSGLFVGVGPALSLGERAYYPVAGAILSLFARPAVLAVYLSAARRAEESLVRALARGLARAPVAFLTEIVRAVGSYAVVIVSVAPGVLVFVLTGSVTVSLLLGLSGVAAGVLPIIVFSQATRFAPHIAIDQGLGPVEALSASWRATEGRRTDLFIFDVVGVVVVLLASFALCVGGLVAAAVVLAGEAVIYVRLARALEPPRRQASIPDGAVVT